MILFGRTKESSMVVILDLFDRIISLLNARYVTNLPSIKLFSTTRRQFGNLKASKIMSMGPMVPPRYKKCQGHNCYFGSQKLFSLWYLSSLVWSHCGATVVTGVRGLVEFFLSEGGMVNQSDADKYFYVTPS